MKRSLFALSLAAGLGATSGAFAQSHEHGHAHDGHAAPAAPAKPAAGKKWASDAPLRKGMETIRALTTSSLHKAHEGKLTAAEYAALGSQVDGEIKTIFAQCKLAPEADQALHGVLAQMMEGSKIMQAKEGKPVNGLMKIVSGLNQYGELFEHPGWKSVQH